MCETIEMATSTKLYQSFVFRYAFFHGVQIFFFFRFSLQSHSIDIHRCKWETGNDEYEAYRNSMLSAYYYYHAIATEPRTATETV